MRISVRLLPTAVAILALLASALPCAAQPASPRDDLLALVPADVGFCVLVRDLRGHAQKWERAPWIQSLRQLPLVQAIIESPEARQLGAFEGELKKHLGVDWQGLRDDILGDRVVIAYRPGAAGQPEAEEGMIALRAARPKRLAELVDRFNELQKNSGELHALDTLKHHSATYYRRVHVRNTHYYYLHGPLLVVAGSEDMLRQAIDRDIEPAANGGPWAARFRRAGAEQALVTVAINPQALDPFPRPAKGEKPQGFAGFWRALDGAFLTVAADAKLALRLSLQGRVADMPSWAQPLFTETVEPSTLWQRFPEPSILTLAGRTDFANLAKSVLQTLPQPERAKLTEGLQAGLKLITRLDLVDDVLPNLGPDWGLCVLPPADGAALPQMIAALAVKPGSGAEPVDETLFKGVQLFAGLAVVDHNRKNPEAPIKVESVHQGSITVKFLSQPKLFPMGFRPACALKDGFLVFASTPDAIARFGPRSGSPMSKGETPLLRLSPPDLAQLLRGRREQVVQDIRQKHQLSPLDAERNLDQLLALLDLFEAVTLTQRTEPGQATWTLRVLPRNK
jgi:hypothetical protein